MFRSRAFWSVIVGLILSRFQVEDIFPWGFPVVRREGRGEYREVNFTEDSLRFRHGRTKLVYGRGHGKSYIKGPERVVVNPLDETIYLLTADGLLSMTDLKDDSDNNTATAEITWIRGLGSGRPLGGAFTKDGKTLYVADAVLGLIRIRDFHNSHSKVEIVVSSSTIPESLTLVDDVCIGSKSNKVYFTSSTEIRADAIGRNPPDVMYTFKLDLSRGIPTGRVLEYDPVTDQVRTLVRGLHFANGIALAGKHEDYLIFAETSDFRIWKYTLTGAKAGESQVVVDRSDLMGYPDGIDCNKKTGKCYAAIPSPVVPVHKLLMFAPFPLIEWILRTLLIMLPRQLAPAPIPFGGILEFDPNSKTPSSTLRYILDPNGKDIGLITGVTVFREKLYLGSLHNDFIGLYDLA